MTSDEQRAREWLALQGITGWIEGAKDYAISDLAALLARRALEARNEALEEAAQHLEHWAAMEPESSHDAMAVTLARQIRSLAAASKTAGGGQ